jgi:hypothetical protein
MAGADRVRQRWRNALVVLEVAVTVALLVVTSSMIGGYRRALSGNLGFAPQPLIAAAVQRRDGVNIDQIVARLERVPGVASVAASTTILYGSLGTQAAVATDARGSNGVGARQSDIAPAFFRTLGVRIRSGRMFTTADTPVTRVAIVNEALATRLFGERTAVGRSLCAGA